MRILSANPDSAARDAAAHDALADHLDSLLPQTQCTKCGFADCRAYAQAMAREEADVNQCPPGGIEGVARLAAVLGKAIMPINPANGVERPRPVAVIDEALCIGCTLCIQACPVDAIVGAAKQMHTVLPDLCTGCDLCVAPCPVDCISMEAVTPPGKTGWAAWSQPQADAARQRYDFRTFRLQREKQENDARLAAKAAAKLRQLELESSSDPVQAKEQARKKAIVQAAMERARLKKLEQDKQQEEQDHQQQQQEQQQQEQQQQQQQQRKQTPEQQ